MEGTTMSKIETMTDAESSAWLIGQFILAKALVDAFANGDDLDATLNECLKQVAESSRENGNMALFFETIALRQRLMKASKI
jgi:hypothetical protein